jgi:hypothetical protein
VAKRLEQLRRRACRIATFDIDAHAERVVVEQTDAQ